MDRVFKNEKDKKTTQNFLKRFEAIEGFQQQIN